MDIKYYDLLSAAIIGVVVVAVVNHVFFDNVDIDSIAYIAFGYLVGYFINAIGSSLENIYYWSIGGAPYEELLTIKSKQDWTGCKKVKFYEVRRLTETIKKELDDPNASSHKMFECAKRKVNGCENSRVPAFNAQFAWSRTILTTILISLFLFAFEYYGEWIFWVVSLLLLYISWKRFKERGYYYEREVFNEYLIQSSLSND